jgi:hypothetical protein
MGIEPISLDRQSNMLAITPMRHMVGEEGLEPSAFTQWEQIYSLSQKHQSLQFAHIWLGRWGSNPQPYG